MPDVLKQGVLLVAEDDPDDQMLIRDAMAALGEKIDVRFVRDGDELLAYLYENGEEQPPPEVILLDLNMPGKDGRSALREMKADPILTELPVVVLTTSRAEEDRRYCQYYGAEAFYQKPSSFKELIRILNTVFSRYLSGGSESSPP